LCATAHFSIMDSRRRVMISPGETLLTSTSSFRPSSAKAFARATIT
jgi:hypothetical protein